MYRINCVCGMMLLLAYSTVSAKSQRPNIVIFLADDLGIGDVGCFGNDTIRTPSLDRMAREGVKLTQHFAGASFCTPSRAALLTGRYPIRSGMAADTPSLIRFLLFLASTAGLPPNETTFAELAQSVGYKTALVGKWHLGLHQNKYGDNVHNPINHGFGYYYGLPYTNLKDYGQEGVDISNSGFPQWRLRFITMVIVISTSMFFLNKNDVIRSKLLALILALLLSSPVFLAYFVCSNMTLLNSVLLRNTDVVEQPIHLRDLTPRLVREGVKFIEDRKQDEAPFLLMMSWSLVHTHISTMPEFTGKSKHERYGDGVEELDWGTGQILDALDRNGFGENTFSYFSSDNGGHLEEKGARDEQDGGWNGIYTGGKTHGAVEGAIRVPTIAKWPARIPKNTATNEPTIFMDVLPTIANIIGAKIPSDRFIDGKDMLPLLTRQESKTRHRFMVHYCASTVHAARYRPDTGSTVWKLTYYRPDYIKGSEECLFGCTCYKAIKQDPPLLYDINKDPSERHPIDYSSDKKLQDIVQIMKDKTEEHIQSVLPVPLQFARTRLMWRYSLQPCCNGPFPFCSCREEKMT